MISVILPIYNTEKYLGQCIESLINQTYKDIEFICIDDGSTDHSGEIADRYAAIDSRIRLVHQKNTGESHARNVGLQMAKGEYIAFCDCDDWIEADMYETLVSAMEEDDLDMAAGGWFKDVCVNSEEQNQSEKDSWKPKEVINEKQVEKNVFGQRQLLHYLYERDAYRGFTYMWNKLYKREILTEDNGQMILFDESLKLGGDVIYLAKVALNVKRAKYIDRCFYHYRMRSVSGSHTKDLNSFHDWIKAYDITIEIYKRNNVEEIIVKLLERFLAYHASEAAGIAVEKKDADELIRFQTCMSKYQGVYEELNASHPEWIDRYRKLLEEKL